MGEGGKAFDVVLEFAITFRGDDGAEGIDDFFGAVQLDGAELDDFAGEVVAELLIRGGIFGNGLVPLQVQDDIIHDDKTSLKQNRIRAYI